MILTVGSRVGPYQIVAPLGAGGMGEVYRARDPRIGREVAVKVLPPAFAAHAGSVRRFEQEARAAGALSHPGLLTIFDVGTHDGILYIVSELLEGSTLRERMTERALPMRRVVDYALQIARGLAVAHDKGIVHRDLKPENIFITDDDRVKLLDFGLAKVLDDDRVLATADALTQKQEYERPDTGSGVVIGTVAYMSPEQVRGQAIDHRTDVFAFGIVLYEMLGGVRPFRGPSHVETMAAILHEDPPQLPPAVTTALERIVLHALQKSPAQRFQSMTDVVFALETFSSGGESATVTPKPRTKREAKASRTPADVKFRRASFRRGFIMTARFAPDGSIVYGASWEDEPNEIFAAHPNNPESRPVGLASALASADILAVAPNGELAVSLGRHFIGGWVTSGTLARVPSFGGAPRELAADVQDADWTPHGHALAVIRTEGERFVIEMPLGTRIYESAEWISHVRVSPKGDRIAFLQHERWGDDGGRVVVIGSHGERLVESNSYHSMAGLAWTPGGDEVWMSAHHEGTGRDVMALSMRGKERVVLPAAGWFTLHDIAPDGRLLMAVESGRREMVQGTRDGVERNLTWLDWSFLAGISPDGSRVLFEEQVGARRNNANAVYVRKSDGSPAVRFGEGTARSFSPDGRLIGVIPPGSDSLHLLPVGVGTPKTVPLRGLESCLWWDWTPDATRLVIWAHHRDAGSRHFVLTIDGDEPPQPVTPPGCGWWFGIAPDSTSIVASMPDRAPMIYPLAGGNPIPVPGGEPGDLPIQWSHDGAIFVFRPGRLHIAIDRIDLATGARTRWHDLHPTDPAGIMDIQPIFMTRDGNHYAYAYRRFISDLYIVEGLL